MRLKNTIPGLFNFFCDGSEGCVLINADHMRLPVPMWGSMLLVLVSNFESGDSTDHASCRTHVTTVRIITIRPGCTLSIPVPTTIRFDRASWPQPLWRMKLSFQPDRFGDAMFSEEQANSHKQTAIQTQTTIQHPHVNDARPSFDVIQLFEIESTTIEKHFLFRTCSVPNKS